ncbi:hypothetical protein WR25_03319 [Diploscapter pachys]|uniref:Myosin tail domain-containing protein n=1 Tax=Diploscapter pachys TaxID=2018661 RepID=A0A2A2L3N4_9BILA|nr:hypothetical protein WR25_03319 [Diploscapter pachys]
MSRFIFIACVATFLCISYGSAQFKNGDNFGNNDELSEHLEGARRENSQMAQKVKGLTSQLGEGSRSVHELQKIVRRLELEKEELQKALDDAEAALEAEESKVPRTQIEVSQIRSEIEKRTQEKDELAQQTEAVEHARRNAEADAIKLREQNNDLKNQPNAVNGIKIKLEGELQAMHAELDEALAELKNADKMGKKVAADAARLAEELRQEQEQSMHVERLRKGLEVQIKEMRVRLDEAAALKGGKKGIAQLEARIRSFEQELDGEQRIKQNKFTN